MHTAQHCIQDDYLLLELPPNSLTHEQSASAMQELSHFCRRNQLRKVLVWRKNQDRMQASYAELLNLANLMEKSELQPYNIALTMPPHAYEERLEHFAMAVQERGIHMELFFNLAMARSWLAER